MFIYFSRLFERHRKEHKLIIPIAIFTADDSKNERDTLSMEVLDHQILHFQFLKLELKNRNWRQFIDSNNPVAAALLAKMGYNEDERQELRKAYLQMMLRLKSTLNDALLRLTRSIADLYFQPTEEEDRAIIRELMEKFPEEGEQLMELMPAWERWAMERGKKEWELETIRKLLDNGFEPEKLAKALEIPLDEVQRAAKNR
jgi:hypothetical protein